MRKRPLIVLIVLLLVAVIVTLLTGGGNIRNAERIVGESSLYTKREIEAAMDVAVNRFRRNFDDCKLLRIAYDEEKTLSEQEYQMEKHGKDGIIVLVSDFYVGNHAEPTFSPNQTYKNWKWILEKSAFGWKLIGSGYA